MSELNKQIITTLALVKEEVLAGCKCGGSGEERVYRDHLGIVDSVDPCPDCAEVRALDLPVPKHDLRYSHPIGGIYWKCACGEEGYNHYKVKEHVNPEIPDLTTHMHGSKLFLVHVMQVLGVWEGFLWELNQKVLEEEFPRASIEGGNCYTLPHVSKIIADGEHLVPVIGAWLKERGDG